MNHHIIQNNEFPDLPDQIENLFLDTETTSFDPKLKSIDVWKSCWIAGIAFSYEDCETIWFVPIRYRDSYSEEKNNDLSLTKEFIDSLLRRSKRWINHNIKYDYHVLTREGYTIDHLELYDTLTSAKLVESDRFVYNEDALAADWLKMDQVDVYKQAMKPWIEASNDWGEVPIDKIGIYACHDIHKNRLLYKYIKENLHPDCSSIESVEQKVTKCLCRTEQVGLCVDTLELKKEEYQTTCEMLTIVEQIRQDHGLIMRPNVNADCYEIFHNKFGLPVVKLTEKGDGPSYDKFALETLKQYPSAPKELIGACLRYRKCSSHNGFVKSYSSLELNGRLHASYNQCIRTGRMSCSDPNMQQLDKPAKALIHPPNGYVFLSFDFSAIEFRLLAHYLGQQDILEAYANDPDKDFHQWVADMCHVKRKPAKNINFCMAYGGGKGKVLSMLANNADVIAELANVDASPEEFESLCRNRAESIFNTYHRVLHRLRPLTTMAANRLKARGYVKNGAGRHRQLPIKACYRALNTVIQSFAADIMKEAVVNTSPIYNSFLREHGVEQVAYVHDEILFIVPRKYIESGYLDNNCVFVPDREKKDKKYCLEALGYDAPNEIVSNIVGGMLSYSDRLTVPLRVSAAIGLNNWADLVELPKELIYVSG